VASLSGRGVGERGGPLALTPCAVRWAQLPAKAARAVPHAEAARARRAKGRREWGKAEHSGARMPRRQGAQRACASFRKEAPCALPRSLTRGSGATARGRRRRRGGVQRRGDRRECARASHGVWGTGRGGGSRGVRGTLAAERRRAWRARRAFERRPARSCLGAFSATAGCMGGGGEPRRAARSGRPSSRERPAARGAEPHLGAEGGGRGAGRWALAGSLGWCYRCGRRDTRSEALLGRRGDLWCLCPRAHGSQARAPRPEPRSAPWPPAIPARFSGASFEVGVASEARSRALRRE